MNLLICPSCLNDALLNINESQIGRHLFCEICGGIYLVENDIPNLIDLRALLQLPQERLAIWHITQNLAIGLYKANDLASCGVFSREDVQRFRTFINIEEKDVLDIGSGSFTLPGYVQQSTYRSYIGIDPVSSGIKPSFPVVPALAEQLPFENDMFDVVLFATSLDHCIDIRSAALEAHRVLRPNGRVYLWQALFEDPKWLGQASRRPLLARRNQNKPIFLHSNAIGEYLKYQTDYKKSLRTIESDTSRYDHLRVDHYHFQHLTRQSVVDAFALANLSVVREEEYLDLERGGTWRGVFLEFADSSVAYQFQVQKVTATISLAEKQRQYIDELNARLNILNQQLSEAKLQIAELSAFQTSTNEQTGKLAEQFVEAKSQIAELSAVQISTNEQTGKFAEQLAEVKSQITELAILKNSAETQQNQLKKQFDELAAVKHLSEAQQRQLNEQFTEVKSQITQLSDANHAVFELATRLTHQLDLKEASIKSVIAVQVEEQKKRIAVEDSVQGFRQQNQELLALVYGLKKDLDRSERRFIEFDDRMQARFLNYEQNLDFANERLTYQHSTANDKFDLLEKKLSDFTYTNHRIQYLERQIEIYYHKLAYFPHPLWRALNHLSRTIAPFDTALTKLVHIAKLWRLRLNGLLIAYQEKRVRDRAKSLPQNQESTLSNNTLLNTEHTWIEDFKRKHGRPPRILHVGNIANNAYINAKLLRDVGLECDVICYDYYHIMACPEWEDADFEGEIKDSFKPNWKEVELNNFKRPSWFIQMSQIEAIEQLLYMRDKLLNSVLSKNFDEKIQELVQLFQTAFPDRADQLSEADLLMWQSVIPKWQELFMRYDLVQAYSTDGILPLLAAKKPYFCFEHGTLRDIPFKSDAQGRRTALAYQQAAHVFVTNIDCLVNAHKLANERVTFINHPFDEDHGLKITDVEDLHQKLCQELDADFLFFFPTRHDWVTGMGFADKANNIFLEAFCKLRKSGFRVGLICCAWGKNVDQSRLLLENNQCDQYVHWTPTLGTVKFERMCRACQVVVDQFKLGAFGGVLFKAMAVGSPICTFINETLMLEKYPEVPPVINCRTTQQIFDQISLLIQTPDRLQQYSIASRRWITKYHSKHDTINAQLRVYKAELEKMQLL